MINKSPIYQQLNNVLRKLISDDKYTEGDKFLTERAVCELYEVSRVTANKALSSLVAEGLLEFKKGVGTFIKSKPTASDRISPLVDFREDAKQAGKTPTIKVLLFEILNAGDIDRSISVKLNLNSDDKVIRIDKLKLADGIPMAIENRFIIEKYCPHIQNESIEGPIDSLLENKYKLLVSETEKQINAVNVNKTEADLMKIEPGTAVITIASTGFMDNRTPLWWKKTYYRPDGFEFIYKADTNRLQQLTGRIV